MKADKADPTSIELRGVRVHNLRGIDVDIPLGKLTVVTGVSGSGKSSLAFDTLFAEGQRRYIESFPAYARQFLPKFDKPTADAINHVPPALAIGQNQRAGAGRTTVAGAAGLLDYLRIVYSRRAKLTCPWCQLPVQANTADRLWAALLEEQVGQEILVGFSLTDWPSDPEELRDALLADGLTRVWIADTLVHVGRQGLEAFAAHLAADRYAIIDRLRVDVNDASRWLETLESGFKRGHGEVAIAINGTWRRYADDLRCSQCQRQFPAAEPFLFQPTHPLAACESCEGNGDKAVFDEQKIVPHPERSLQEKALAILVSEQSTTDLHYFLDGCRRAGVPIDKPYQSLSKQQRDVVWEGSTDAGFPGIRGILEHYQTKRYKQHIRILLHRLQTYEKCETCAGTGFKREIAGYRLGPYALPDLLQLTITRAERELTALADMDAENVRLWRPVVERLTYLTRVGLGYLTLDRPVRTLSLGESRRVAMTTAFATGLARTLFVLDEPTAGLHPRNTAALVGAITDLVGDQNTVVVVEHDQQLLTAADHVVDLGPRAGADGGRLLYQGPPAGLANVTDSLTAKTWGQPPQIKKFPRQIKKRLRLTGANTHCLKAIDVEFPLQALTVIAGVSGAGKSSLVLGTLVPALRHEREQVPLPPNCRYKTLQNAQAIADLVVVDAEAVTRTSRSAPVTYIKAFDDVRSAFAALPDAKLRNFKAGDFSFNSGDGRCTLCEGLGYQTVDMQFLAEVTLQCDECHGSRYRKAILEIKYQGLTIADVLGLTAREAFSFFRKEPKIQEKIKRLMDVGLGYVTLGQPLATLSGGELQRLKLANYLGVEVNRGSLFVFEEPTTGLHAADVEVLLAVMDSLVDAGHTVLVVEHHLPLIAWADHIIELGPAAGDEGGQIVFTGSALELLSVPTATGIALSQSQGKNQPT